MTSFLLIISFLLHLITFAIIVKLFQQLQQARQPETTDTKEVQQLLESYLREIKEENKKLENRLTEKKANSTEQFEEETVMETKEKEVSPPIDTVEDFLPNYEEKGNDTVEASLESRVMQLHAQGYTVERIARQLDCGKTEAEIIIKMHQKSH